MGVNRTYQIRREARLCVTCGVVRGDGSTETRCTVCAEKMRQSDRLYASQNPKRKLTLSPQARENRQRYHARRYADLIAAGLCTLCRRQRTTTEAAQGRVCADCRLHRKAIADRARQRKRDQEAGLPEGSDYHWPHGVLPVLPKGDGESLHLHLNQRSYTALLNLWKRYRESEIDAGRQPHMRRASQLVREAIHQWQDRLIGPSSYPETLMVRTITVYLDPETLRILQWQARACFKGNKSAALRTILTAVGYPRPVPVAIPRRRDKWNEDEP